MHASFRSLGVIEMTKKADFHCQKEARRVTTPPMSAETSPKLQLRGLSFDFSPEEQSGASSTHSTALYPPRRARSRESHTPQYSRSPWYSPHSPDWWEKDDPKARAVAENDLARKRDLDADISLLPEHLPSSPLCPKNPMHKSKGRGVCAYHGRQRSVSLRRHVGGDNSGGYDPYTEYGWYGQKIGKIA